MRKFYFLLLSVLFAGVTNAQLTGTKTIPGDYASVAAAVTDLNAVGVGAGGVTFNIAAAYTESTTAALNITATGTSANPIVFQKSGSGANPKVTRTDAGANATSALGGLGDAVISINGTDYITFDGIDVAATNATGAVEYGYLTSKPSATDGCQNVTIKNSTITMTKSTSGYVVGIYIGNGTASTSSATGVTVTATSGTNRNITIIGNTIQNVHAGIIFRGSSATGFYDDNMIVGQSGAGNTIVNFGGGSATSTYGVYFIYVNGALVDYNTINNAGGGGSAHGSTLYGIFYSTVSGVISGSNNTFTLANSSASSTTNYIYQANTVTQETYNNNTFASGTISSTGTVYLIYAYSNTNDKTISGNSITGTLARTGAGAIYCYYNLGSPTGGTETFTNNNFSNITNTGSGATYGFYSNTATAQSRVVSGNTFSTWTGGTGSTYAIYALSTTTNQINNNTVSSITCGGIFYGVYASGTTANVYSNSISTITNSGTFYGVYVYGTTNNAYSNTISGITNNSTSSSSYGIYASSTGATSTVYSNTVSGISSAGTTTVGIYTGAGTANFYKNKVHTINSSNTNPVVYGFQVGAGTTVNVLNNLIGNLTSPSANAAIPLAGIYVSGGTTVNLYYNTVYLNASSTGALFGSAALYASTTPTLTANNNIFVNTSTAAGSTGFTAAYRRSSTTLTSYGSTSNSNDFYAGAPSASNLIFYDGTNSDQTLTDYKTRVSTRDGASVTENPTFISTTGTNANFLHLSTSAPTQLESGATPISGVTDDFDGNTRNATTPDIGADEGTFILLDINPPGVTYTPLSFTCDGSARTLTATITDASGVPTSGSGLPVLYWKINTGAYTAVTATYVSGSTYSFTFGAGAVLGDVISYYIVAQDNAGTPNVGSTPSTGAAGFTANPPAAATPPTTPTSYTINGTLSGIYTVGVAGTYPTLTAAVADYNSKCLTGPVTFSLLDASYSASETFPIYIYPNTTASATNTLTIKPASGVTATISGLTTTNFPLILYGADYVTLDGSNSAGGTTRDLTIKNTNTSTSGVATIFILSQGAGAGATNNTIKNCIIEGPATGSSTTYAFGVYVGANGSANGPDNDNLTLQNNWIRKAYYGIQAIGSSSNVNDNFKLLDNVIGSSASGEAIGINALYIGYSTDATISGNDIYGITSSSSFNAITIATGLTNSSFASNKVRDMINNGTNRATGVSIGSGNDANITFANNMLSGIINNGTGGNSYGAYGFQITAGTGYKFYYNTVNMSGDRDAVATTKPSSISAALMVTSTNAATLDLRNNIFVNKQTAATNGPKSYAIYSASPNTSFSTIDYNNYLVAGAQGVLGYLTSDLTNLAAIQASAGFGQNLNSLNAATSFVSNSDLHLTNALGDNLCLNGAATPITGITTDFDAQTRNATKPDIGADEFNPTMPTFLVTNQSACFGNTVNLTLSGVTTGSTAGQTYTYFTDAACTTAVTDATAVGAGTYYIKATYGTAPCSLEQVLPVTVTINALPTQFTVTGGGSYCATGSGVAVGLSSSQSGVNYQLQIGGVNTGSPVAGTGSAISFGNQTAAGTYTVVATDATTNCTNTMTGSVTVSIDPLPTQYNVTGGGSYCATGSGVAVGLSNSQSGVNYQLQIGGVNTGSPVAGTGSAISFGNQTVAGTYTVVATNATTNCTNTMTGSVTVSIDPLPTQYNVTGGGAYCATGVGSNVGLSNSQNGVNYQLVLNGTTNVGSPVAGTNSAISFGTQTTAGTYTVVATNATTLCTQNMTGSVTVSINPLPVIFYTLTQPNNCNANNGGADLTITNGTSPYTFNWTGSGSIQGQEDQTTLRVGAYTVVVTDANGCQKSAAFSLIGPGGCDICPTIGTVSTTPAAICQGGTATLSATDLLDMGVSYGIDFVVSATPLVDPYTGTVAATVSNGSLVVTNPGPPVINSATTTATFNTPGNLYVYAILSPAPADPACRPFKSTQIQVNATPDVNAVANQTVCSGSQTSAVNFSGTVPGTIYTWTNSAPSIGLAASGTGNIPSFTATNFTNAPVTATITVTPTNPILAPATQTFNYTGAAQTWTVPAGVTSINVEANGAQGGRVDLTGYWNPCCLDGGLGGKVTSTLAVTPGQVLNIYVGGIGNTNGTGGYNGGGTAAQIAGYNVGGAGGGGATDVRVGGTAISNRVVVAGAGGGAGGDGGPTGGGAGGGLIGGAPAAANSPNTVLATGGTQTAGGAGGYFNGGYTNSTDGFAGQGGGNTGTDGVYAGGGSGYYGGGGGTWAGGAGGSSYTDPTLCTNVTHTQGANVGNGSLTITYLAPSNNVCPGPSKTFTITVSPIPTVNTVAPVTACNGATVNVPFSGFVPGTVYQWTNSNTAIGLAASGSGDLNFTATNTGITPITGNIIVTPKFNVVGAFNGNLVSNGGFESGSLGAWTLAGNNSGFSCDQGFQVYSGNVNNCLFSGGQDYTPPQGSFGISAAFDGAGPLGREFRQSITLPSNLSSANLSFMNQYAVDLQNYCSGCSSRIFEVNLLDASGSNLLTNLYSMTLAPGSIHTQPWTNQTANVLNQLTPYLGQNVTLSFKLIVPQSFTGPGWIAFDSVGLNVTSGLTCTGTPIAFPITINPTPTVNAVTSQTVCNTNTTTAVSFSGAVTGTVYNWTNDNPSIGLAASGTGNIGSFTAINTGNSPVTATITVTPSYTNGGSTCTGTATTFTITVLPSGKVNAISNQTVCNGDNTAAVTFTTPNTGGTTTYSWTNNTTSIGLGASGTGNIPSFTGINTGTTPVTATITVTPTFTSTGGAITNLVANGGFESGTLGPWTLAGTNSGTGCDQGFQIYSGNVNNCNYSAATCGGAPLDYTQPQGGYGVSAAFDGAGPLGREIRQQITLPNSLSSANLSFMNQYDVDLQTYCAGCTGTRIMEVNLLDATGASLLTNLYNVTLAPGAKYCQPWNTQNLNVLSALAPYVGQNVTLSIKLTIPQSFTGPGWVAFDSVALNVVSLACTGTPRTFTITVNPTPTVNPVNSLVVCNGAATGAINFSGAVAGTNFSWTNSNTAIGLAASGTGNIPTFNAVNTGTTPVTSTITVTPTTPGLLQYTVYSTHGGNGNTSQYGPYANNANDFDVMFNTANSLTTVYSSGTASPSLLLSWGSWPQLNNGGVPVPNNGNYFGVQVTGTFKAAETGVYSFGVDGDDGVDVSINGTVITSFYGAHGFGGYRYGNVSLVAGQTYTFRARMQEWGGGEGLAVVWKRPSQSAYSIQPDEFPGCAGSSTSFTITVNPTPTVNVVSNQTVCNGGSTSAVTFSGAVTGTVYNWTNNTTSIGLAASGTGDIPSFTGVNTTNAPITATITVTPSFTNGSVTCNGTPRTFTITVNPTPTVNAVSNQVICNGANTTAVTFTGAVTGTVYSWTNNTTSIGLAATGTGNIASFVATNTGVTPVTATITVTPSYTNNGVTCTGTPTTFTITVNPTPTVTQPANQVLCNGSNTTAVTFTGAVAGTVYNWTNNTTSIGLAASGTGNIASFVGVNNGVVPVVATITVTPSYTNGGVTCTGTPRTFTITVNPTPTVNQPASQVVCNQSTTTAVAFSGAVAGTVYNWTNSTPSIGLAASGTGDIAAFTAINTTQTPVVATITVTPSFTNGGVTCTGTPRTFTITVNPTPIVVATDLFNRRICISDGAIALNGTPVGGYWSGIGVSGFNFIPSATAVGNYVLTYSYTNQYACTWSDTTLAKVLACDERNISLSQGGAVIYPNPNGGQFNIRVNSTRFQYLQMRIYNALGQLISTKQWSGLVYGQVLPVDMRHLPAAVYTVRIIYDGGNLYEDKGYQLLIQH